jgi:hypothetical protein
MEQNKVFYIADYGREGKEEDFILIKIENYQAYEYWNKKWSEAPGLYSMLNDPGPWAEHIDENRAKEIMKIIDKYDLKNSG